MITDTTVFGIIGLGVLGGSYAKALSAKHYKVLAVDINTSALQEAEKNGWITEGSTDPSLLSACDIVVSCLYPHTFINWLKEHQDVLKSGCLLSDVTGVKREVMQAVNQQLRKDVEYIACHPMAGRESRGLAYADEKRFLGANFIIVPGENNTADAIATAHQLAEILGFSRIAELSPEEHDRMIGFLSQLTHVIAVSLMNVADNTHLAAYTGDSFRDLTRIANINEELWPELFVLNKDNLSREIDAFVAEMKSFEKLIQDEDYDRMKQKLILATKRRKAFNKDQEKGEEKK